MVSLRYGTFYRVDPIKFTFNYFPGAGLYPGLDLGPKEDAMTKRNTRT